MYGKLQLYRTEIDYIEMVFPTKAMYLKDKIDLLVLYLEKNNSEDDPEIQEAFKQFEEEFKEIKKQADGEYTLQEMESINKEMDTLFDKCEGYDYNLLGQINKFLEDIKKIQDKIDSNDRSGTPLLVNVARQRFDNVSLRAEYRLKMLKQMQEPENNVFKGLSELKQRVFSKFFLDDVKAASKQYEEIMEHFELYNEYSCSTMNYISKAGEEIIGLLVNAQMVDDFSIRQVFDSKNKSIDSAKVISKFLELKMKMNYLRNNLEKYKESKKKSEDDARKKEAERLKKEEEDKIEKEKRELADAEENKRLAAMTDTEICKEIDRIEHDLSADGSRFVNILDFQKKVARAKGLLDSEEITQNEKLVYKNFNGYDVMRVIKRGNAAGVNYMVFPNAQETGNGGYTVAVSKSDEKILSMDGCSIKNKLSDKKDRYYWRTKMVAGVFPETMLAELYEELRNQKDMDNIFDNISATQVRPGFYQLELGYEEGHRLGDRSKDAVLNIINSKVKELGELGEIAGFEKDVLCNIRMPANTNIIPILEELKKAGIVAYIEPVPHEPQYRNGNNRDFIHIYFERKNLQRYQEVVAPELNKKQKRTIELYSNSKIGEKVKDSIEKSMKDSQLALS